MDERRDEPKRKPRRRIEILTGGAPRRWSGALKAKIVAESFAPGAVVAALARRHGTRASQIHLWRKHARAGLLDLPAASGGFAEVVAAAPERPSRSSAAPAPIEIMTDRVTVAVRCGADAALVSVVVRALQP
jgi:transposase